MSGDHVFARSPILDDTVTQQSIETSKGEGDVGKEKKGKLRVAFLIDSFTQPSWIHKIIADVTRSSFAEIVLIISGKGSTNHGDARNRRLFGNGEVLLWSLCSRLDDLSESPYPDPFEKIDILPLLTGCPILSIQSVNVNQEQLLNQEDVSSILRYHLDVILNFSKTTVGGAVLGMATFGVWSASSTTNSSQRTAPTGFWEIMKGELTTEFTFRMTSAELKHSKILYRSWTSTDLCSMKGTRSRMYWKSAIAVVRKLRKLYQRGPLSLEDENSQLTTDSNDFRECSQPTNFQMLTFLGKVVRRRLERRLLNATYLEQWFLAYKFVEPSGPYPSFDNLKHIRPPRDRFWADPFPVAKGGHYYIFVEEFLYSSMKGHISVLEMDSDGTWKEPTKILERDYHLSYPFLFEWDGNLYMIPETKRKNRIELYRCSQFPYEWEFDRVLIKDIQAVDATLHENNGTWWLFCSIGGRDYPSNDELYIFHARLPLGPWTPHIHNPVQSDVRSARPAGKFFSWRGDLFRPSQDCSMRMGGALCINRVNRLSQEDFREELVARIEPKWMRGIYGTHTINTCDKLMVTDCFGYVRKHF